jgi:hypothetical protein
MSDPEDERSADAPTDGAPGGAPATASGRVAATLAAPALTLAGWCAFAWYVFWQGTVGTPLIWTDSATYATVAMHPVWSTGFWAGQRPPFVPFVLKLAGSSNGFVAVQALAAVASWGFLAFTVGRMVPPGWRRVVASWLVLAFATTTPITLWNRSVLSESLSLSLLALLFAATIWAARRITWPRVCALTAIAAGFATTRDAQVWTVAVFGVAVGVFALVWTRRDPRLLRRTGVLALALLLTAGLTGWDTAHTGRTRQNVANVLFVRVFPFPQRVAWFAAHGMPEERAIDLLAAETAPPSKGAAKVVGFDPTDPAYAPLEHWIVNSGQSTFLLWIITHPTYLITEPLIRPERSFNFANGNLLFYAAPGRVDSPATVVLWPAWWWLVPMTLVSFAVAALTGMWRRRSWLVVAALGALGIVTMLVAWNGDGQEVTRHTIEGFAEVRLGVLLLIVVAVLGDWSRLRGRHARSAATPDGAGPLDQADGGTAEQEIERGGTASRPG